MTTNSDTLSKKAIIDATLVHRPNLWINKQARRPYIQKDYSADTLYLKIPKGWESNVQTNVSWEEHITKHNISRMSPLLPMPDFSDEIKQRLGDYPFNYLLQVEEYALYQNEIIHTVIWYEFEIRKKKIKQYQLGEMSMEFIK